MGDTLDRSRDSWGSSTFPNWHPILMLQLKRDADNLKSPDAEHRKSAFPCPVILGYALTKTHAHPRCKTARAFPTSMRAVPSRRATATAMSTAL